MEGRSCRRGLATTLVLSTQQYLARGHWMTGCGAGQRWAVLYAAMRRSTVQCAPIPCYGTLVSSLLVAPNTTYCTMYSAEQHPQEGRSPTHKTHAKPPNLQTLSLILPIPSHIPLRSVNPRCPVSFPQSQVAVFRSRRGTMYPVTHVLVGDPFWSALAPSGPDPDDGA